MWENACKSTKQGLWGQRGVNKNKMGRIWNHFATTCWLISNQENTYRRRFFQENDIASASETRVSRNIEKHIVTECWIELHIKNDQKFPQIFQTGLRNSEAKDHITAMIRFRRLSWSASAKSLPYIGLQTGKTPVNNPPDKDVHFVQQTPTLRTFLVPKIS